MGKKNKVLGKTTTYEKIKALLYDAYCLGYSAGEEHIRNERLSTNQKILDASRFGEINLKLNQPTGDIANYKIKLTGYIVADLPDE